MSKIPIVFFGSGPVAARSLELLVSNFDVTAVVTKPKPQHHKGDFPVISLASRLGLPLFTVANKKELASLISKKPFSTDLAILIDFGIIVTRDVIDYFPKGIINSHFSILPQWRGADPITFSILSGQIKTGVSLMLIDEGMDTGKILKQKSLEISNQDTSASLTERLIKLSDDLLQENIPTYLSGSLVARNQPHQDRATYSRKLAKQDGKIDWNKSASVIEREIRAYKEWPKSFTTLADIDVIITSAEVITTPGKLTPGEIYLDKKLMIIGTIDGALKINSVQLPGKKEMPIEAFLAGYKSRLT